MKSKIHWMVFEEIDFEFEIHKSICIDFVLPHGGKKGPRYR